MIIKSFKMLMWSTKGILKSICFLLFFSFIATGCFQNVVQREPLPSITWPQAPDQPRIRFINSISNPADTNITESSAEKFLNYFWKKKTPPVSSPHGVTVDSEGRLYVVDTWIKRVHVFNAQENSHSTFPEKGAALKFPIDIAVARNGRIFVSDSQEAVINVFENQGSRFVGELGKGFLKRPTGVVVHEITGDLLVADTVSSEIIRYDIETLKFKGRFGTEGKGQGMLHSPISIAVSLEGDIIVSDSLNFRVQVFGSDGTFKHAFGEAGDGPGYFARPKGVASDSDGNIYVVDALFDNVQMFDSEGRHLMAFGSPGYGYGKFWLPSGIFIDSNDRIYVSDTFNNRIQVFEYMKGDSPSQ